MRTIILNNKIIEYDVKYNAKKNINIAVNPDLTIKVSAPRWVLKSQVEKVLSQKSNWIIDSLEKQKKLLREKKVNCFENGHMVWFKGDKYRFYYRPSDKNNVFVTNDQIICFTKRPEDSEYSKAVFEKWLKKAAEKDFEEALHKYSTKMGRRYNVPDYNLQVRTMKTRWGTCIPSKKKITLNLSLMYAPHECLEYVALHELTHFQEIYHNERFYDIMEEFMPDYKERTTTLNKEFGQIGKES